MKLPKHLPIKPLFLILAVVLAILSLGVYYFFLKPQVKTLDDFPIMVINNGQTAVYQEVKVTKDKIEKEIVVSSLGNDNQKEIKIYEYIPKEVAQKASELKFNVQPQILEDDPIVLWKVDRSNPEPVQLGYSVKIAWETTQCIDKGYAADMKNVYKLDPYNFDDCYKYLHIKFLDAVYKNQKRREQEGKDQVKLIQPGEKQYQEIQKKAKELLKPVKPSNSKISAQEAVLAIKKCQFSEYQKWGLQCNATFAPEDPGWRVICGRRNFVQNNYTFNWHYEFYKVKDNKSCMQLGLYESNTDSLGNTSPVIGAPMWGIK